jgi:hypothetical protein
MEVENENPLEIPIRACHDRSKNIHENEKAAAVHVAEDEGRRHPT